MDFEASLQFRAQQRIAAVLGQAMIDKIVAEERAALIGETANELKTQLDTALASLKGAADGAAQAEADV